MIAIDLGEKAKKQIGRAEFTLGLIPYGKLELLRLEFAQAFQAVTKAREAGADPNGEEMARLADAALGVCVDICRWGLKGWNLARLPLALEPEQFAGQSFEVVRRDVIEALRYVRHGVLLNELALAVLQANTLSEDDLLGFT